MTSPSIAAPIANGVHSDAAADPPSLLPDPNAGVEGTPDSEDAEFGFSRPEMGKEALAGTVQIYERHVFLRYKSPEVWPPNVEGPDSDRLPRLLASEIKARKGDMSKKTRLTICEGEDGTDNANGDVLIFPDMIKYRRLTHFDVETFVEEVLVKDIEWTICPSEPLSGSYVFVCAHGSRDRRCGVCGPALLSKFQEEITSRGLQDQVFASPCSHIGGHKYAGNVIIYSKNPKGEVTGHWYGYVTPEHVPALLEEHIGKGKIIDHLWRGQMGLSADDQKAALSLRLQLNSGNGADGCANVKPGAAGCCQGANNTSCCQVTQGETQEKSHVETPIVTHKSKNTDEKPNNSNGPSKRKVCAMPTWFETWEREDTYAALAVVAAVAAVAVAYRCYRL